MENIIDLYEKIGFSPVSASITEKLNAKGTPIKDGNVCETIICMNCTGYEYCRVCMQDELGMSS